MEFPPVFDNIINSGGGGGGGGGGSEALKKRILYTEITISLYKAYRGRGPKKANLLYRWAVIALCCPHAFP